jgi:hypothetical protein
MALGSLSLFVGIAGCLERGGRALIRKCLGIWCTGGQAARRFETNRCQSGARVAIDAAWLTRIPRPWRLRRRRVL